MNKKEFAITAMAIKSAYPASKILEDDASMTLWYEMLKDLDFTITQNAIKEFMCTSVYPPNIAEIRKLYMERTKPKIKSFDDAWSTVLDGMHQYGSYEPKKAFEKMDALTAEIVHNIGWYELCMSTNIAVERANFQRAYEKKAQEQYGAMMLPEFVAREKHLMQDQYIGIEQKDEVEDDEPEGDGSDQGY